MKAKIDLTIYVLIHTRNGDIYNTEISIDKKQIEDRRVGIFLTFGQEVKPKQNTVKPDCYPLEIINRKWYTLPPTDRIEIHSRAISATLTA